MFRFLNKNRGFTLIEMMITALIFSIVVGAVIGIFVSAIRIQRYNLVYQQLLDQTSYAMEYMSRAIRMAVKDPGLNCISAGYNYQTDTGDIGSNIKFINYKGECQEFFLDNNGQLKVEIKELGGAPIIADALTSFENFEVTSLSFRLSGESDSDNIQPRVTISMKIQGRKIDLQPRIIIQTTVSQRNPDF